MKRVHKKGQTILDNMAGIAMALIPMVIILVIGFLIIAEGKSQAISNIASESVLNETVTAVAATEVAFATPDLVSALCDVVSNATGTVVPAVNYSCAIGGFTLNEDNFGAGCCNVSYTFQQADIATNATDSMAEALSIVPDFTSIIVIALVGAALLSLVLLFTSRRT